MTSPFVEPLPKRKRKKGPDDEITKNVVVLKSSQVCEMGGVVLMPKTTLDMSGIKKLGQSKKITFTKNTSSGDLQRKLEEKFPFLEEASGRFYCAKAVENRSKLDFCGDRCVWSGAFINKNITGNSALYIYCEEEKEGDSGHCSSDPDLPGAPVYGNCLVTAAPQGRKRFGSESCPTAEGPIDKETLRAVESQTCGTVRESDRNYRPFGEPEGVKTQVIEKEASACALTVGREAAEEEQIQDQNPNTWLLTPQPPLLLSDIREQTNRFTLAPLLESLPVCSKDIEIQEPYDQASTETLTAKGSQRAQQNTSVTVGDSDNQESSSEDRSDSGFETCTTPQDTSRNRDSLLSNTNTTGSPEPDEYETNNDFEDSILNQAAWFQINEDFKEVYSCYPGAKELKWPINPHELPLIDHNLRSEENGQDTLSRNSQNNAEVEETNQDVAQEISHPQVEGDEPNHIVEQEQFVRTICPSSSRLEGGGNFQISLKEELPEHIQSGYASFGNELVVLTKFNKLTLAGTIPAAQEPGVVKVRVFSDTDEFLGETDFQYEDMLNTVVFQAVQLGPDGLSKLFALMEKHMWNQRSSATQSSSAKQNSGQATGALNDSCQDRSSPVENTVMDDEYEDLVQHFQDFVKWLSEQSFHPIHSNTDTWLKLSNAVEGLCRKLACSEDEENFKGNQQTCSQEREENYFADAENSSCMSSEDDSASLSDPDNWSETFNACTEAEEDLEGDQLTCTQKRDENYFPNTEDYSSVSSETDSALSDSESWDESISDSSLSFSWVNSRSNKSLEAIPETESTQNSYKAVYSKLDVSHEILAPMTEGFTTEDSIGDNTFVGCGVCHKWNTSLPESKESEENCGKDDHNEKQDSSQEWVFYSEEGTSHTLLASHDDTPLHCLDVPTLNVENEESQYQDDELFETLHTNAEPQLSESICSVTSNQQSVTHPEPITQEAAQSPLSNPLWNGDSKLNMAPQQCSEEEIHSGQEWEESGEDLASWFNLCENEDTGKNEHSRWEISMEPSKTDGGVEKDIFDSEEDLSQEQGLISEQGDFHTRLSLPDDTSVQSRGPRVENEESQSIGDISIVEAARNGYTDTVRLLVEKGADVNQSGSMISKVTKLILAARKGQTDIVWLVLKEAIDQNKTVNWFCEHSPLTAAARNGHPDIVRLLIENRADVNKGEWSIGDISIVGAARNDYTDTVHLLVKKGADVNQSGSMGLPLTEAVKNGHTNIVRLLIENGADVNKGGLDTPLTEAAMNGHVFIVRLLIENGADVNKGGLDTPLTAAVRNGHTDIVRLLIQNGADVNQGGLDTPLTEAVANGHTDIVRLLIKNGANVNQGGLNLKHNPLTAAISYGHTDIVRLLIENGADVDQEGGDTSLDVAVKNGHTDIVRLLIENGADVNKGGGILLTEAVRKGHTDIVRLFIENGADVNQGGGNLLTEAVRKGHTDIVRLFIENGADVTQGGGVCIIIIGSVGIGRSILARSFIKNRTDVKQGGVWTSKEEHQRRKFVADDRTHFQGTKLSLERELDVQLKGKKTANVRKRPGKRLKTQTEMTSPRDIVEEGKCGKDSTIDVELGLNCLHLSPKCEQFFVMVESPGDSSIMHHDFKPINKHMDRVTLTDVGKAKQGHCVVVEIAKTHPSSDTIIIYGRKINEEGSSLVEVFQLATKDLKDTWEYEEMIIKNVQIGSVVKYVQVGDEFLFQGNTKRPRWDMDRIFLDFSCTDGAHRSIGNAFPNSKLLAEDSYQDCTPKETCFITLKCGLVENDRISVITKLGELLNLKLNCREDVILPLSPSTLELSHVEVNKDVVDGAVVEMREPLLISGVDGLSKPSYPVLGEGLNLRDESKETSVEAENPETDLEEKDDEDGNAFESQEI